MPILDAGQCRSTNIHNCYVLRWYELGKEPHIKEETFSKIASLLSRKEWLEHNDDVRIIEAVAQITLMGETPLDLAA